MNERCRFILAWEQRLEEAQGGRGNVADLCRQFGVSRTTGHLWINRYQDSGFDLRAMEERSRAPHHHPATVSQAMEDRIVEARKLNPHWGPRTLRRWLIDRGSTRAIPSHSCISQIFKRRGLIKPRGRRPRGKPLSVVAPFPACASVNDTWCIDFKGWFRTLDRVKCYPLTLIDACSRFLLRCEPLLDPDGFETKRILDSAFCEFGLPSAIRSDGGPPFASTGPTCLSRLMVWLLHLGITIEVIAPAKPQQNGRLERFHRTLKLEVPPAASIREQIRSYDAFRRTYNFERPHHALALSTPGSVYFPSTVRYPRKLIGTDCSQIIPGHVESVDRDGFIRWHRNRIFISQALSLELVTVSPGEGTRWQVFFGAIPLGHFDPSDSSRRLVGFRRPKGPMRLSLVHGLS